jgi:uncharacterized protein
MNYCDFALEVKQQVTQEGVFRGYAAVYENVDSVGDVIERGAFAETLRRKSRLPVLWSHDVAAPVGLGELSDSLEGLMVQAELDLDTQAGRETYSRVRKGIVGGLSIGFRVPDGGAVERDGIRRLKRIDLMEVSLVAFPANDRARVLAVKSAIAKPSDFERALREMGYSRREATAICCHGWKGLAQAQEPDPDTELRAWLAQQLK